MSDPVTTVSTDDKPMIPAEVQQLPNYLGPIRYAPGETIANCLAAEFTDAEDLNFHFEKNRNQMLVALIPGPRGGFIGLLGKVVSDEDTAEMDEIMEIVHEEQAKRKAARAEAAERAAEAQAEAEKLNAELLALGRKVKEHNIIEKNRKLEAEVAELKKELKKLQKATK